MHETWFSLPDGKLHVGSLAVQQATEAYQMADIRPLRDLVLDQEVTFDSERYTKLRVTDWQRSDFIAYGKWVLNVLDTDEALPPLLGVTQLDRLYHLGIGPNKRYFRRDRAGFRSVGDFLRQIGARAYGFKRLYDDWGDQEYIDYGLSLNGGKRVNERHIEYGASLGYGPGHARLIQEVGGIHALNEMMGFYNVRKWDFDDFRRWGGKVLLANSDQGTPFSVVVVDALRRQDRGPSSRTILNRFGTWRNFKAEAGSAAEELKLEEHKARLMVAEHSVPNAEDTRLAALATLPTEQFVGRLKKLSKASEAEIEITALTLGVSDTIWPLDEYRRRLRLSPAQLKEARRLQAQRRQRSRKR